MNKTVNINLAGIFFHIDEDAYAKLQHYLEAIKRSLTGTHGRDEIINDIEARIAELFSEKIKNERQVISIKEVDEVISVMGQPEDYMLDEEIFEDETSYTQTKGKKLFRDTEHSYVGGVSSGLGHYLGISAIWLRIAWILLTIFSTGAFILIYIALWIFVPEAKTTADKLAMRGEPVTISNIERKIREGFDDVAGKMKDINNE
jgi:phage shock protein PspC (stress-responsive transcriptional regulator)